jgi:transposase
VQGADQGDTTTIGETVTAAAEDLEAVAAVTDQHTTVIEEVVADKGYHSNQVLVDLAALDLRTYIAEPDRGRRRWTTSTAARDAVYANRRRIRGTRGRALRPNAHLYETGGLRRTHLRGHSNILKRVLVHVGGFNLGLFMRARFGIGTPRSLQGRLVSLIPLIAPLITALIERCRDIGDRAIDRAHSPQHRFELLSASVAEAL